MAEVDPDLVKRLAELVDAPPWEMADLLVERFPEEEFGNRTGIKTGLYAELDSYEDAVRKDYGIELKASTMQTYRATALAWPGSARTQPAAFDAYRRLRGKDRESLMQRYLKRNKGQPLSGRHVQRYRADDKGPGVVLTPEERFERGIRSAVKSRLLGTRKPEGDWWKDVSIDVDTREMAAGVLQRLINDLLGGLDG